MKEDSKDWASALSTSPGPPPSSRASSRQRVTPSATLSTTPTFTRSKFTLSSHHRKIFLGVLLITLTTGLWVTMTQLGKSTYQFETHGFFAPFFVVYFSTAWLIVVYPVYLFGHLICTRGKMSLKETLRENARVYSDEDLSYHPGRVIAKVVCFSLLWVISCYVYLRALYMKPCLDVITLFATNSSFVYLLSWILLQKQFMSIRIVAIILAMGGVCTLTYMDGGFSSHSLWGAVLAVTSTSGAASYKVLLRKIAGEATLGQVSLFLSCVGLFSIVTLWPLLLLLYFTRAEPIDWERVPWVLLCSTAGTALLLNFTFNHGASITYPVLLQITFILAIPVTAAVDLVWRRETFSGMQVAASVLIFLSAVLNLLPPHCPTCLTHAIIFKPRHQGSAAGGNTTSSTTNTNSSSSVKTTTRTITISRPKKQKRPNATATGTTTTFLGPRQTIRSTAC